MTHIRNLTVGLVLCLVLFATGLYAGEAHYVGAKKCKTCHNKKKETMQFDIWKSSAHAGAYITLAGEKAKEYALKAGIEGDPQKAAACLECHVTGYGLADSLFAASYLAEDGVQCEACHGPGSKYKSAKIMSKKKYADKREEQHKLALDAGLVIPDEKTCLKCHNDRSPAFKGFEFKAYYEKIKHEYAK